jgi:DNA-binding response OmpR family regulator
MAKASNKILCIEDDCEIAMLISEELTERGFEVMIAREGHSGFIAILKGIHDLVLCDVGLPHMSGMELLERLNELSPRLARIPFVFLTARSDRADEMQARKLGADNYITKPIDFDALEAIISARLGGVARNKSWLKQANLSDCEAVALAWVARGKTSVEIARILKMPKETVDFHLDNARVKLGAPTRAAAVAMG